MTKLLDVTKMQQGKLGYNITEFDFDSMLTAAAEAVQLTAVQHSIIKSGGSIGIVKGDKERLEQVVINLLSNAIKYSPQGHTVLIHTEKQNGQITVSVKDDGIGIPAAAIAKVFEPYYRVSENQFQGMGIGLFICWEIIRHHDGKMWAESELGKGSTFYFTLPDKPAA